MNIPTLRRLFTLTMLLIALLPAWAAPALAHNVSGQGASNFRTTLTALTPPVPGVSLQVIENGSRLELRNTTGTDVVVRGYIGEPYARVGPSGTFVNDNSPATYVNADRYGRTAVPAGVDPKNPPRWRKVSDSADFRWHDHRIHWMLPTLPPAVARYSADFHRISTWTITLDYGDRQLTANGELDWVPGPNPAGWLVALIFLVLVTAFGLPARAPRVVAAAVATLVGVDVLHSALIAAASSGMTAALSAFVTGNLIQLPCWIAGAAAAVLLARGRINAAWIAAAAGVAIAFASGVSDLPALWRSSSPMIGPLWLERLMIVLITAIGFGLALAMPLYVRSRHLAATPRPAAHTTPPAPADAPAIGDPDPNLTAEDLPSPRPEADDIASEGTASPQQDEGDPGTRPQEEGVDRRRFLTATGVAGLSGAGAGAAIASLASGQGPSAAPTAAAPAQATVGAATVPFTGPHQPGITTPAQQQARAWVAAFDLRPGADKTALRALLRRWSDAAEKMSRGEPASVAADDLIAAGTGPSSLTVTIGFGPSLFGKASLPAAARPAALTPLPAFHGDQLDLARSDGDLGVVVCADDALVVFHAARTLQRLAKGTASLRWQMSGFARTPGAAADPASTQRNLMGQLDGTNNPKTADPAFTSKVFAPANADPAWMRGGSYLVIRRIRMLLDQWENLPATQQERVIGRHKNSGAPLSGGTEFTPANYGMKSPDGTFAIPENAHIRLSTAAFNRGATILRRGYNYADGTRPDGTPDAGLIFMAWQADPRTGFIPIQQQLTTAGDALNAFIRHETSALFAMPPAATPGGYLGQDLLGP